MHGGDGNDTIFAGGDNDLLFGGSDNDRLYGEDGDDRIDGGGGADILTGGNGADSFVFVRGEIGIGADRDTITDFRHGDDRIALSAFNDAWHPLSFLGNAHAVAGTAGIYFAASTGVLSIDADGDGVVEAEILLKGVKTLSADDLIL